MEICCSAVFQFRKPSLFQFRFRSTFNNGSKAESEPFSHSSHRSVLIPGREGGACARVRACWEEQLEHLQPSPLTAAEHMAGPGEGWVLSPGKVLTHRQERRATRAPRGRGGNS